jgi:hypothetical protein
MSRLETYYTIGAVARHFAGLYGVPLHPWQVRRTIERGFLAEPPRVGAYRVFTADDLPRIEAALRRVGYLPAEARETRRAP